jgi:hypothetical protein
MYLQQKNLKTLSIVLLLSLFSTNLIANESAKRQNTISAINNIVEEAMDDESKVAHEINLAGKQRMLTQKMSKEIILIALNVEPKRNRERLKKTSTLFDKTINGFLRGDSTLSLSATTEKPIIAQIEKIIKHWEKFNTHVKSIIKKKSIDTASLIYVINNNIPLLKESHKLVLLYKQNTTRILAPIEKDLRNIIDLAGKQRMLTQKMTKEKILIIGGLRVKENEKLLLSSVNLFDKTLKGLIRGDKDLGLPGVTNSDLKKQLLTVKSIWNELKPLYKKDDISNQELAIIIDKNLPLLKEMNKAVNMFEKTSDF